MSKAKDAARYTLLQSIGYIGFIALFARACIEWDHSIPYLHTAGLWVFGFFATMLLANGILGATRAMVLLHLKEPKGKPDPAKAKAQAARIEHELHERHGHMWPSIMQLAADILFSAFLAAIGHPILALMYTIGAVLEEVTERKYRPQGMRDWLSIIAKEKQVQP